MTAETWKDIPGYLKKCVANNKPCKGLHFQFYKEETE